MDYETAVNHGYPIIDTAGGPTFLLPKDMFLDDLLEAVANGVFGAWEELTTRPEYKAVQAGVEDVAKAETYTPTSGMKTAAKRALRWKEEGKATGAGTPVGWGRATDIVAGRGMSLSTVKRMYSFFSRHEVDKQGKDFDNTANPSNGRIMWDAWGGDSGFSWSRGIVERTKDDVAKYAAGQPRNAHGQFGFVQDANGKPYELKPDDRLRRSREVSNYDYYRDGETDYDGQPEGKYGPQSAVLCAGGIDNFHGNYKIETMQSLAFNANDRPHNEQMSPIKTHLTDIVNDPEYPQVPEQWRQAGIKEHANSYWAETNLSEEQVNAAGLKLMKAQDPEAWADYCKTENNFVEQKLGQVKMQSGQTVKEIVDSIERDTIAQLGEYARTMDVSVSLGKSRLAKFIGDDHYKTAYELGRLNDKGSGSETYFALRNDFESKMGVPSWTKGANRPVYGVLGDLGTQVYGDSSIILKPSVKERVSLTIGDSLDGETQGAIWASDYANGTVSSEDFWRVNGKQIYRFTYDNTWNGSKAIYDAKARTGYTGIYSAGDASMDKRDTYPIVTGYKGVGKVNNWAVNGYIEAQIHGGVSIKDVAHVIIPSSDALTRAQKAAISVDGATIEVSPEIAALRD